MNPPRMRPRIDASNEPFWKGGADGKLNVLQCRDCAQFIHPPLPLCRNCQSENITPMALPGTGVIDTFTVNHQKWYPGVETPYVMRGCAWMERPGLS